MSKKSEALALPVESGITESPPAALAPQGTDSAQIMGLLHTAIDRGISADTMEKLVALHERVQDRNARGEFFRALSRFKAECPPVRKNKTAKIAGRSGGGYEFTFADFEQIAETVRPHLEANGFSYTFDSEVTDDQKMLTCTCILRHIEGHAEQSKFMLPTESASGATPQQKVGGALTYAKRQTLISVLGLSLTDAPDDDQVVRSADAGTITAAQVAELQKLVETTSTDAGRFLNHFGIDSYGELPAGRFSEAVSILKAKQKRVQS